MEGVMQSRGNAGSSTGSPSQPIMRGLLSDKDVQLPQVPSAKPSNEEFRRWLRIFARYCKRQQGFPFADMVFEAILETEDPIDNASAVTKLLLESQSVKTEEYPDGPDLTISTYWTLLREKELYDGVEFALSNVNGEVLSMVTKGQGYELMRVMIRQYDPRDPSLRQCYTA